MLAFANDVSTQAASGGIAGFIPFILIIVIFYFIVIRPQNKKMKEHASMVSALKAKDRVQLSGGIIGVIKAVNEKEIELEIAKNVVINASTSSVVNLLEDDKKAKVEVKSKPATANKSKAATSKPAAKAAPKKTAPKKTAAKKTTTKKAAK